MDTFCPSKVWDGPSGNTAYYIKADPKSNIAGLKFWDISWCFVKFGLSEGLPHLI